MGVYIWRCLKLCFLYLGHGLGCICRFTDGAVVRIHILITIPSLHDSTNASSSALAVIDITTDYECRAGFLELQ